MRKFSRRPGRCRTLLFRNGRANSKRLQATFLEGETSSLNHKTRLQSFSGFLGAIAGVFFASYTHLSPSMWVAPLIIAIAIVIVGGIGSIIGTLVVAHIIGFMEIISVALISPQLRGVFTMLLVIIVLIIRPKGLFGREEL